MAHAETSQTSSAISTPRPPLLCLWGPVCRLCSLLPGRTLAGGDQHPARSLPVFEECQCQSPCPGKFAKVDAAMWFPSCPVRWVTSDLRVLELPGKSYVATNMLLRDAQERTAVQDPTQIPSKTVRKTGTH